MMPGASTEATARFSQRHAGLDPGHVRRVQDLTVSSIGLGTYLGDPDDATDARYIDAIRAAATLGCNLLDTAINYRCQRSERAVGQAVEALAAEGACSRDELVLCTKGGYLPYDGEPPADPGRYVRDTVIAPGLARPEEIIDGCHCLAPAYLDHALKTSLANLRVRTIDVYYLHNPEQQLGAVSREEVDRRLEAAFTLLEQRAQAGVVRYYGVATWNGLRVNPRAREYLSLEALAGLAERVGGRTHHFRAIQLPYNLAMPEAYAFQNQPVQGETLTVLEAARRLELAVVVSASLLQSRLTRMPASLGEHIPGLATAAQRAVQFARSTPGVAAALVGMQQRAHVEENLELARLPALSPERVRGLFDRARSR